MIKKEIGAMLGFTGGSETTPFVEIVTPNHVSFCNPTDRVYKISQGTGYVLISAETLKNIQAWGESE